MESQVDNVKRLCKERNIPISTLERECGFSNGYISSLKKGYLPPDRILAIMKYLNVPMAVITGIEDSDEEQKTYFSNRFPDSSDKNSFYVPQGYDFIFRTCSDIFIEGKAVVEVWQDEQLRERLLTYAQKLLELKDMENI